MCTFVGHNFTFATACRTNRLCLHLSQNSTLHLGYIARTMASIARFRAMTIACTTPIAMRTSDVFIYFNFFLYTSSNFSQCQFHFYTQIGTSTHTLSARATTAKTTKSTKWTAKMSAENIAEMREYVIHIHAGTSTKTAVITHACVSKLIVTLTFLWVAQHFVGFSSFFKVFFRYFITGIFVGMKFNSFLTIRFFYFFSRGGLRYAKHFIIISFFHVGLFYWPTTTLGKRITLSFIK